VAVAIKILRAELAGQRMWTQRLAREVRLARQINHPHVCRVFDFEQADGRAFVVMELAGKGTLRDELRTGSLAARPAAERIADARAVASALEAIHRAGIIHRDVSPQNLLRMGDGRLVVSDFGLAVDVSEGTSSVHGGTVAYMAPEVLRGGPATFASDIWGLGVVMHEIVFGMKPRWSESATPTMLPPKLRRLTREERAVFETCRACTARDPADRLVREGDVARMLAERPRWWRRAWGWRRAAARRPVVLAGALTLAAAVAVGGLWARHRWPVLVTQPSAQALLIAPTGEAADWTDTSTVLVEVPDRITCTRLLPDRRTIRFVWGTPPRAEDFDLVTRKRGPSPLVPAAYAEGCPDLSPDGKRLVFQSHTPEGRAFAFVSERPDGKDAVPAVQTAEPTMSSEPTWLPDGESFSYDVDPKHMGVFSTVEARLTVLPEPTLRPFVTSFRSVAGGRIFVSRTSETLDTDLVAHSWPLLREELRLRYSGIVMDLVRDPLDALYFVDTTKTQYAQIVAIYPDIRRARRLGRIRDRIIRYPQLSAAGFTFVSVHAGADLFAKASDGSMTRVTHDWKVFNAANCAGDFIVQRYEDSIRSDGNRETTIERIDRRGARVAVLEHGAAEGPPGCSPDGNIIFLVGSSTPGITRCERGKCRRLSSIAAHSLAVSPDGRRLVVLTFDQRGVEVWLLKSDTGEARYISESETGCRPGWASMDSLWISRRRAGEFVWVEVNADSGRETGRVVRGSRDCSDGGFDPASPVDPNIRIVNDQTSQLRLLDMKFLKRD
jgi:hypothetical protein